MQTDRDVVIDLPQRVVPTGTTRHGLVIGINHYADERLNLRYAVADARDLHELMVDPECGCFPPENVQLLVDHEATKNGIFGALARLRKRAAESDMVWVYYAGHAAVEDNAYWVTHDADVDDLYATALHCEHINSVFAQLRTRRVLQILDCCSAETTALMKNQTRQSATAKELLDRFEGHGVITLAASDRGQKSAELSELGHGVFTYFLAKGLRGDADTDNEGVVTAEKLWSYLRGKVKAASSSAGNLQTPMLSGNMTHDMALTLNAAAAANKRRLMSGIEKFVGLRADQLTTDEGRFCVDVLRRSPRTKDEQALLASVEELVDGKLTLAQFRRLLQLGMPTIRTATNVKAPAAAEGERARVEVKEESWVPEEAEAYAAEAERVWAAAMAEVEARTEAETEVRAAAKAERASDESTRTNANAGAEAKRRGS